MSDYKLFFSIDIINSTKLKYDSKNEWKTIIKEGFYDLFPKIWDNQCSCMEIFNLKPSKVKIKLARPIEWKKNGDEILYVVDFFDSYSNFNVVDDNYKKEDIIKNIYEIALWQIICFRRSIIVFNNESKDIKVKGTAWYADFPQNNEVIDSKNNDYIGKSIDIGFRLTKYAEVGKLIISVELAIILMRDNYITLERNDVRLHIERREVLKGVLWDAPYPIIWINMQDKLTELELELQSNNRQCATKIMEYLEEYIKSSNNEMKYPEVIDTRYDVK